MCGRYELSSHPAAIALAFGLSHPPDIHPRYNIAPTQQVPIIRRNAAGVRELVQVRWGLVPRWARDPSIGAHMINARAETIATKGAFRNAFERHRCLVPANGFYEWRTTPYGKQPLHVGMPDGRPFGLAGLYERWLSPEGDVLDTCTIVTASACEALRSVHDRMPVIIAAADYARWLDGSRHDVGDLLAPWSGEPLRIYPVSTRVNAVRNDDAQLCDPVAPMPESDAAARSSAEHGKGARSHGGTAHVPVRESAGDAPADDDPVQPRLL